METINISLNIQTLKETDEIEIEVKGVLICYKKKFYIISVHQGYPIKSISINNKKYDDYIICAWCDLLILPLLSNDFSYSFVFKQFVKKQMEPTDKYFINNNKLKFINHEFFEIGMIPNNPKIMYNCLELDSKSENNMIINNIIIGEPVYNDKKKLAGLVSIINDYIYTIPINYIFNALNKKDNTKIYSLNENYDYIQKINKNKVINGKIYCSLHKMYIPIESYVIINSEINYSLLLINGRIKDVQLIIINNNNYNNNLIIKDNTITATAGFMNYLKIIDEVDLLNDLLLRLFKSPSYNLQLYTYHID
jgi:hypothetical protein